MTPIPPPGAGTFRRAQRLARVRLGLVLSVALLAAGIAGLGYLVSFEAISSFVVRIGAFPDSLRWCGPLLVDTFITLATLFLVWLALSGVQLRQCWDAYYAWVLVAVATIASAYLNAAHVQPSIQTGAVRWDARIAAGAVPFAVLASVHLLVLLLLKLLAWTPAQEPGVQVAALEEPRREERRRDFVEITSPAAPARDTKPRRTAKQRSHAGVWGATRPGDAGEASDVAGGPGSYRSLSQSLLRPAAPRARKARFEQRSAPCVMHTFTTQLLSCIWRSITGRARLTNLSGCRPAARLVGRPQSSHQGRRGCNQ